jgi:hypothetical protein
MPLYTCECCNISTKIINHHKRHLLTKKHLKKLEEITLMNQNEPQKNQNEPQKNQNEPQKNQSEKNYSCLYCADTFNTLPSKRRHELHRCKQKPEKGDTKLIEALKNEKKEKKLLYKQIEKLIDKAGNTTYNTQNIKLNGFGKEDLSHITDSFKTKLLNGPYGMIPKMIEQVHFSEDKPENKNISLTNSRDNKMKVFTGDKWVYKNKDEIIHDLMDGKYFIMDTHYESMCEDLNDINQSRYETFRDFFDDREKKMYEQQKKECELVLLNNR